jgi:hypothetical protein
MKEATQNRVPTPDEYNEAQEAQKAKQPAPSTGDGSKVFAAISKIMAEVGTVKKDGKNTFHNYAYATAADIAHALQKKVADAGLVIVQTENKMETHFDNSILTVEYSFILSHISGEQLPFIITKTGASSLKNSKGGIDDKAINKCSTAALKYFLLALFLIPTGDYDDADADGDTDGAPPKPRATQSKSQDKAPPQAAEKPVEEVSAPVDAATGTVTPHAIPVPMVEGKGDPVGWSSLYIAAINAAKDEPELDAWVKLNAKLMGDVAKYAAKAHKGIVEALEAKRKAFEVAKNVTAG